jgi:CO/xanthine dehydrogenase FAD-binding subunit
MVNYLPQSLKEALQYRDQYDVIPYGGGTDLMIDARTDVNYLFLHKVPELRTIRADSDQIYLGASCTFTQVAEHPLCPPILKEAIWGIAAPAIRNLGTIGGNIGNGSAKADSALIFFVTDAKLRLTSKSGERIVPITAFYLGRKKLDLKRDELITEIIMPKAGLTNYYYQKIGARKALAISRAAFAGILDIQDGMIKNCATAFGAVSDIIIRRPELDGILIGKTIAEAKSVKETYLAAYDEAIVPIQGRVSECYRKTVCMNLLKDFLSKNNI